MKVFHTNVIKFAIVETDLGEFQVSRSGGISVWKDDVMDYCHVEEWDYDDGVIASIRAVGLKAMGE